MATNIDSALSPMDPMLMTDEPAIEIEIEDPEAVNIGIGGVEIELTPETPRQKILTQTSRSSWTRGRCSP